MIDNLIITDHSVNQLFVDISQGSEGKGVFSNALIVNQLQSFFGARFGLDEGQDKENGG